MWPTIRDQRPFVAVFGGLVVTTWLSLWVWGQSPYSGFLSHEELEHVHAVAGGYAVIVVLFVAAWTLMTVAMMLPTSLPLLALFYSLVRQRANRIRLVGLVVLGYLGVWTVFGALVHLADRGVHEVVAHSAVLEANEWAISAGTILLAGAYQFTALKERCLQKCRSPLSFIMERWRGGRETAHALRLGLSHGLFCLGCCWSLMLLMFAVGVGSIAWMLALGTVMAVEKNLPWGRRLTVPLGLVLLAVGFVLVAMRTALPGASS
jgi:predicted metal-binding membrane protein